MTEVFTLIVDRRGNAGRTERFVDIEVHISNDPLVVNWELLDWRGEKDLKRYATDKEYEAFSGVAHISWKSDADHDSCIADHESDEKRQKRWRHMETILGRMKRGEFPQFGHAYLHPSLTGNAGLTVIDGTRRMLAYLALGHTKMPVVVFRSLPQ